MAWLNYTGHSPAEFPLQIHGGGSVSPHLLQPHNPIADAFKVIAPALKAYMDKKKNDEIANQLMNMENPPRAEAVDPSLQGAPATAPAASGASGYKMQQMYQDYLNNQPDTATDDLNYQILWNKAHPDEAPDENGMTDYQKEQTRLRQLDIQRKLDNPRGTGTKADPWANAIAVARGKIKTDKDSDSLVKGKVGEFTNQYTGADAGDQVKLITPSGYTMVVPWSAYQARQQQPIGAQMYQSKVQGELPAPDLPPDTTKPVPANPNEQVATSNGAPPDQERVIAQARAAIARGADPDAVRKRVEKAGYDSSDLY